MQHETRKELQDLVIRLAPPHYATPDAPETLDQLLSWKASHKAPGHELPVSSLYCDRTIYLSPEGNHAFRAWHDWLHILTGRGMNLIDEVAIGVIHAQAARAYGCSPEAVEALLWDTAGQSLYYEAKGEFPVDQFEFVRYCLAQWPGQTPEQFAPELSITDRGTCAVITHFAGLLRRF